jgi:pyocin large subunit-like protein
MVRTIGRAAWAGLLGSAAALSLVACDGGSARAPARDHDAAGASTVTAASGDSREAALTTASYGSSGQIGAARAEPVPLVNGKPMWAANRRHTAEENAQYQFSRDGADFGAGSVDDFVAKTHAFIDSPPAGVQTLTRSNGDRLLYDPKSNVFAVVSRDGAPRTMFKPREGQAYWDQQKARQTEETAGSHDRRYQARDHGPNETGSDDQG